MLRALSATFALALFACTTTPKPVAPVDDSAVAPPGALPMDPQIVRGTLENGLSYLIRPNKNPEHRGQFWLVVDAGSLHEDDDQQGLAHFVEHMAFNGTKSFPKNALVGKLQSLGVQFGAHLNAYTSFDETVYKLQVDTSKPEQVDLALQILSEWAGSISFDSTEVDAERGVVMAEKRMRGGAEQRVAEFLLGKVFGDSLYANRLPIGKPEILENAPREVLLRYYRDWYHPANMTVIAVGDFDKADIEKKLTASFKGLAAVDSPRKRPATELPAGKDIVFAAMNDAELPVSAVVIGHLRPPLKTVTEADMRRNMTENLALTMVSQRLDEKKKRGEARYLVAAGVSTQLVRVASAFAFGAAVKPDDMLGGLEDVLDEIERVKRHGFTQSEFDRATETMLAAMKSGVSEDAAGKQPSGLLAEELVRHTTTGEAVTTRQREMEIAQALIAEVTLADLQAVIGTLLAPEGLVVLAMAPKGAAPPSKEQVVASIEALAKKELHAYADTSSRQPLMKDPPQAGTVVSKKHLAEIDVHEWTLSNGARVFLKPTKFREDEILFRASSPGGHSLTPTKKLAKTLAADTLVHLGGLAGFDSIALEKALAGRRVNVNPYIDEHEEGVNGISTVEDFETMLQLIHLNFVAPRRDERAVGVWRDTTREQLKMSLNKPEVRFALKLEPLNENNNPRRVPWTEESIAALDLDASLELFKDRLNDASDFTFFFVGNIDLATAEPLIATYLASLPDIERKETFKIHRWPAHAKAKRLEVKDGNEPRANISFYFRRPVNPRQISRKDEAAWPMFASALQMQLLDLFREKMGDTYTVSVRAGFRDLRHSADLRVAFQCAPERAAELEKLARAEIARAVKKGLDAGYLDKARAAAVAQMETQLESNSYWRNRLNFLSFHNRPLAQVTSLKAILEGIKEGAVRKAVSRFIHPNKPVVGLLLPSEPAAPEAKPDASEAAPK